MDKSVNYLLDIKPVDTLNFELEEEWKSLIRHAMNEGLKIEDFQEYINYIKFQTWKKDNK